MIVPFATIKTVKESKGNNKIYLFCKHPLKQLFLSYTESYGRAALVISSLFSFDLSHKCPFQDYQN